MNSLVIERHVCGWVCPCYSQEFEKSAMWLENHRGSQDKLSSKKLANDKRPLTCVHKGMKGYYHVAHGLCKVCYTEITKISGGTSGGAEPPAFKR